MRTLVLLGVALPLAALAASALLASPARAEVGRVSVHTGTAEFGPAAAPQQFTVACAPEEQLVSGGYAGGDPQLRIVASHPSDGEGTPVADGSAPRAWTVGVVNTGQAVRTLRVFAACLTGGDSTAGVYAGTQADPSDTTVEAACPQGTVRTGGGYRAVWYARLGAVRVDGSHPAGTRGWALDLTAPANLPARSSATALVVCHTGPVAVVAAEPVEFDLQQASPVCAVGAAANVCVVPQTGSGAARCPHGMALTGGGYRLVSGGPLTGQAAVVDGPASAGGWTVSVTGTTAQDTRVRVRVEPVCLGGVVRPSGPVSDLLPDSGARLNKALALAGGLLGLLLLILLVTLLRRRSGRRSGPPAPGIEVVVRTARFRYRDDAYREDL
ncbi:hypothetical protein [Catellatospora citrea]|uniref:Ig-like domain-containing protein n=1 Tax=Catellatospora citrea TaxID=53366 RepID=A0A8J3KHL5_9ACTN|nr:hypothetical protein [Catellatospora citrea]RKE12334.1 hypothetical protein C8E86_7275 [Catellatospora citrea]GIG00845.1 hypothetical protein Cci01nite_59380 [Catellatospora citrea]